MMWPPRSLDALRKSRVHHLNGWPKCGPSKQWKITQPWKGENTNTWHNVNESRKLHARWMQASGQRPHKCMIPWNGYTREIYRDWTQLVVVRGWAQREPGNDCKYMLRFFLRGWPCSAIKWLRWLHNSVNRPKTTALGKRKKKNHRL